MSKENKDISMFKVVFSYLTKSAINEFTNKQYTQEDLFGYLFGPADKGNISNMINGNLSASSLITTDLQNKINNLQKRDCFKVNTAAIYRVISYNKSEFSNDFLEKTKKNRIYPELFYFEVLKYVIENNNPKLKSPPSTYNVTVETEEITYTALITIISETLNVSKYQAVTFTIPDNELFWADERNDSKHHFLKPYEDRINKSIDLFLELHSIAENCQVLMTYLESSRLKKSVGQIYTFNCQEYFEKQFRKMQSGFTKCSSTEKEVYKRLHELLDNIINKFQGYSAISSKLKEVEKHLSECMPPYNEVTENTNLKSYIRQLSIICYNSSAFVLLEELGEKPSFSLTPVKPERYDVLDDIAKGIKNTTGKKERLEEYAELGRYITGHLNFSNVEINLLCEKLYEDFFRLVNDIEVQDKYIFAKGAEELCSSILGLYEEMYKHTKYRLYRGYSFKNIESDNAAIMQNSIIDRKIALDYLNRGLENTFEFDYTKADNTLGKFAIRLARKGDDSDFSIIQKLNNPSKPYRRAIYVKSDDEEIKKAIADKSVWIVEEINGDERYVACVAVILRYSYEANGQEDNDNSDNSDNVKRENSIFNTDELNKNYEKGYYKKVNRNFKYLDFDSILTNDGRSGVSERSYRGCGFMRMLLVLAEEIAKKEGCDYICATVSSFNTPSKRNFMLNGYNVVDSVAYRLKENQRSEFDVYIKDDRRSSVEERNSYNNRVSEEINTYGDTLNQLGIKPERYREDADVPRDYVVLQIKTIENQE